MTITVPPDLQYGLLEFIAHMNAEDYDALPEDFVKIGIHYFFLKFLLKHFPLYITCTNNSHAFVYP